MIETAQLITRQVQQVSVAAGVRVSVIGTSIILPEQYGQKFTFSIKRLALLLADSSNTGFLTLVGGPQITLNDATTGFTIEILPIETNSVVNPLLATQGVLFTSGPIDISYEEVQNFVSAGAGWRPQFIPFYQVSNSDVAAHNVFQTLQIVYNSKYQQEPNIGQF